MQSGQCVRITTGAAVPVGADSVVQVEDTHLVHASADNTEELEINIMKIPKVGEDIRLSSNFNPIVQFSVCHRTCTVN